MRETEGKGHLSGIEKGKLWIDTTQGLATIAAILAGGYWFFLQRSTKPQVKQRRFGSVSG